MKLRLSDRAASELRRIESYTLGVFGAEQADQYLLDLQNNFEMILDHPKIGRSADNVRSGYRKLLSGSHVIYYTVSDKYVDIVAVLHAQMDVTRYFNE